jgi:UDP-glucose 4-epimerase
MTGAAGFIGSHLADALLMDGHDVVGIDNLTTGRRDNFTGDLIVEDIANRDVFYGVANRVKPELVVHCAASYSNPNYWHRDTDTNVSGTINATLVAKHHGARLVFFQTALPPISSYAITKLAGEQFIGLSGVPAVTFRLANMYGPRNLSGPVPAFFRRMVGEEPCTVVRTRRDMVFVDDLVRGVMTALDYGTTGRFDMCSGEHVRIEQVYWAVAHELGVDRDPNHVAPGADDVTEMQLDPEPAMAALGWYPHVLLEDGIRKAVEWYWANGVAETFTHLEVKG